MIRTYAQADIDRIVAASQSPQVGAMIRTIGGAIGAGASVKSQSPQVGAMIRTLVELVILELLEKVSIPSSRGNDSDVSLTEYVNISG